MVLPHCGHLFNTGACHALAALRVRNRIFEVLRLGTPIRAAYQSRALRKYKCCSGRRPRRHCDVDPAAGDGGLYRRAESISATLAGRALPNRARALLRDLPFPSRSIPVVAGHICGCLRDRNADTPAGLIEDLRE